MCLRHHQDFLERNKMKATRIILAAMVLGTAIGASQASAQCSSNTGSCNTTNTASVTVGALVKLGMTSASTALTAPSVADIEGAVSLDNAGPQFTVKANRSWTLKIKSFNATTFDYVGSDAGVKPIGDLSWATTSGGTYNAITASDATVASGASSNSTTVNSFFRTSWAGGFSALSNAPGTYSLPIVFTLSAP
jgi:hypothetical protein